MTHADSTHFIEKEPPVSLPVSGSRKASFRQHRVGKPTSYLRPTTFNSSCSCRHTITNHIFSFFIMYMENTVRLKFISLKTYPKLQLVPRLFFWIYTEDLVFFGHLHVSFMALTEIIYLFTNTASNLIFQLCFHTPHKLKYFTF